MGMKLRPSVVYLALLAGLAVVGVVSLLVGTPGVLATAWPTPPPAPVGALPDVVPASKVTPVPAPEVPGGVAQQVDPIFAGLVPRIPPRPFVPFVGGEPDPANRVEVEFPAGSLPRTVQVTYEPLASERTAPVEEGSRVLRAFAVNIFDAAGAPIDLTFSAPVRMAVSFSAEDIEASGGDPTRLVLARYEEKRERWNPLLTDHQLGKAKLLVRILRPGVFAVIAEPPPVR